MESGKSFRCYHGPYSLATRPLVPIVRPMVKIREQRIYLIYLIFAGGCSMPRGRQKDRDLRRKHRKNQQRIKGLEVARREKGKKK